jgi:hypothetical protein
MQHLGQERPERQCRCVDVLLVLSEINLGVCKRLLDGLLGQDLGESQTVMLQERRENQAKASWQPAMGYIKRHGTILGIDC